MSSNFGGHEDDWGDFSLYSVDFDFEWPGEPTIRDVLDECSAGTSSYDQVTFTGEVGVLSRDFAPNVVLMVST